MITWKKNWIVSKWNLGTTLVKKRLILVKIFYVIQSVFFFRKFGIWYLCNKIRIFLKTLRFLDFLLFIIMKNLCSIYLIWFFKRFSSSSKFVFKIYDSHWRHEVRAGDLPSDFTQKKNPTTLELMMIWIETILRYLVSRRRSIINLTDVKSPRLTF